MPVLLFRHKILLLLLACLIVSQLATVGATLLATEDTVREGANNDLGFAVEIFDELFEQRYSQLTDSVQVLVDDFGFRSALASQDQPTIRSALENHAARANATLAVFIDEVSLDVISTLDFTAWQNSAMWKNKISRIQQENYLYSLITLEGVHYQTVVVPVMTPARIGWVMMGFSITDELARQFQSLTGLDISIVDINENDANDLVSTLDSFDENALINKLDELNLALNESDTHSAIYELVLANDTYISRSHLLTGSTSPIYAILQKSLQSEMQSYYKLKSNLFLIFQFVLLVTVIIGLFAGSKIISPVSKLSLAAERIGHGEYDVDAQVSGNDEFGRLGKVINSMQRDIAEREERIVHQSRHDELTGLPNRYQARDCVKQAVDQVSGSSECFSLVMFDISGFKKINDTLGHSVGDQVLKEIAGRLREVARRSDTVARMGGDDFLMLLEDTDIEDAKGIISQKIKPLLEDEINIADVKLHVKFNFGLVGFPDHGKDEIHLLRRAEIGLFDAKHEHGSIAVYQKGQDESHLRELTIVSEIDSALKQGQLSMHYQPKINLATGYVNYAEALIRWTHPELGFIPPDEFITILEKTGNIENLTCWIVHETARQCREWLDKGLNVSISINLSALDLANPDIENIIAGSLQHYRVPPAYIVLEITESAIVKDAESASTVLGRLRDSGFKISMDDFGTGYSSLGQLKNLPLDELKIDRSFVMELEEDSQDMVIVKSTIELAHTLGLEVIAEGVEDEVGVRLLQSCGCNKAQGYFFSRPMPADEFEQWQIDNKDTYKVKFHETVFAGNHVSKTYM